MKLIYLIVLFFISVFQIKAFACGCGYQTKENTETITYSYSADYLETGCDLIETVKFASNPDQSFPAIVCSSTYANPSPEGGGGPNSRLPRRECGSVINVDELSVGESVELIGTDMRLHYMSDRVKGRLKNYTFKLPLLEPLDPEVNEENVTKIVVENMWGGESDITEYLPGSVSDFSFTWNGLNRAGEEIIAPLSAEIILRYEYSDKQPQQRGRYIRSIGAYNPKLFGLGGWTLSEHHFLDVEGNTLYRGDGSAEKIFAFILIEKPDGTYEKEEPRRQPPAVAPSFIKPINKKEKTSLLDDRKYAVAAKDGERVFVFNLDGTHYQTRSAKTGALLLSFSYNQNSELVSITDSYGREVLINRPSANTFTITSVGGKVTTATLNLEGYLESITDPAGNTHQATYLVDGLMQTFTEPRGKVSTFSYTLDGRLLEDRNNTGFKSVYEILDEFENSIIIKRTTKEGLETVYNNAFDGDGGVSRSVLNSSGTSKTFLDTPELSTTYTEADGYSYEINYDNFERFEGHTGRAQSINIKTGLMDETISIDSGENVSNLDFFNLISRTSLISFDQRSWQENYSGVNRETTYATPLSRISKIKYNDFNQIIQTSQANFLPVDYVYDAFGRLSSITQGVRTWTYNYNLENELDSYTNPLGRVTSFIYDENSRPIEINNSGKVSKLRYDTNGNISGVKPPGKPFHVFISELFNDLRKYLIPSINGEAKKEIKYSYDDDYRLTKIERPNGEVIDYTYQANTGYLKFIDSPEGRYIRNYKSSTDQLQAVFHPNGMRTGFAYNNDLLRNTNISYNNITSDNITIYKKLKVDQKRVRARETDITSIARYRYDEDELLRKVGDLVINRNVESGFPKTLILNEVREALVYNNDYGELRLRRTFLEDLTELFKEIYIRDDLGRILVRREIKNSQETRYRYVYDQQGKLKRVLKDNQVYKEYTYDPNGNRLEEKESGIITTTGTYDEADRIKTYGSYVFDHDDFGNLIKKIDTVTNIETEYDHSSLGALKEARITDTVSSTTDTVSYINDGLGRRIVRLKNGVFTNRYIYNEDIRIEGETNEDGTSLTQYIYGTRINVPDYMVRDGVRYKFVTDYVGSVRMVVNAEDNSIVQEIDYDDFGRVLSDTSPGFQPFYFAGGLYDIDTKLVRFGAREYDAELARWISVDPIRFEGGTTNLYSYAFNDPINYIDVNGESPIIVGAVIFGSLLLVDAYYIYTDPFRRIERMQQFDEFKDKLFPPKNKCEPGDRNRNDVPRNKFLKRAIAGVR